MEENDVIETYDRDKLTPFRAWNKINRAVKNFSEEPKIKRKGEEVDLNEYMNEAEDDCTIYGVMKKYNGNMTMTEQQLNVMHHKVADELQNIKDLPTAFEQMKAAERAFNDLPIEVRREFSNDINKFHQNGLNWAKKKTKEYNDKIKAAVEAEKAEIAKANAQLNKTNIQEAK